MRRLVSPVEEVIASPEVRSKLGNLGAVPAYLDTQGFTEFLQADLDRARRFVRISERRSPS